MYLRPKAVNAVIVHEARPLAAYVHLPYGMAEAPYRSRFQQGLEPDAAPYGLHFARDEGCTVTFPDDYPRDPKRLIERIIRKLTGLDLIHAIRNRQHVKSADVLWTVMEGEALALAALMAFGALPRRPIVANVVFSFDRWDTFSRLKSAIYRFLMRRVTLWTVHSKASLEIARKVLRKSDSELMYFGVSSVSFPLTEPDMESQVLGSAQATPIRVLAAGGDRTRDWKTFLDAFGNDDRFEMTVVCPWIDPELCSQYTNLHIPPRPRIEAFRKLYHWATFVVVPMHHNRYSGITVALEAAALGKPLICSRTGGVPTYFDEGEVFFVPVADAQALRVIALSATGADRRSKAMKAQQRFRERDYSTKGMARRYVEISNRILGIAKTERIAQGCRALG